MPTSAGTVKRRYVVTTANSPASEVSKDRWNDSLIVTGGANGHILVRDDSLTDGWGWQAILPVLDGGTGNSTLNAFSVLVGNGTNAVAQIAVGATGTVLSGATGANPAFTASPALTSILLPSSTSIVVASAAIKLIATSSFAVGAASIGDWNIDAVGKLTPFNDNTRDMGTSALRARSIYAGTSVVVPLVSTPSGSLTLSSPVYVAVSATAGLTYNVSEVMSWNAKSVDTVYQAASDGFVLGIINALVTATIVRGSLMGLTDAANPPTTPRGGNFVSSEDMTTSGFGVVNNPIRSFHMPVKKGEYYKVRSTTALDATYAVWWVPMGTAG